MADVSFNIAFNKLTIAQIVQLNQLFQLFHLVHIYGHSFFELSRMLMRKNVNNDVSKDWPYCCVPEEKIALAFFPPASLLLKGQGTKHTIVKWSILGSTVFIRLTALRAY